MDIEPCFGLVRSNDFIKKCSFLVLIKYFLFEDKGYLRENRTLKVNYLIQEP